MNKNKVVIIFIIFFLLFLGQCYRSFYLSNKDEEIEVKIDNFQYKAKDVPEIARQEFFLFLNQVDNDEKRIFKRKKVDRQNLKKNIEILKKQGIWDGLLIESDIDFEEYYRSLQDSQKTFQLQLDELLKKVEEEKNLASFREELKKLRQKYKEDIDVFAEFAFRIQKEAKEPMPFFATWAGIGISIAICLTVSFIFSSLSFNDWSERRKAMWSVKKDRRVLQRIKMEYEKERKGKCLGTLFLIFLAFFIIYFPLQFQIFPLLNCLLTLKMRSLREIYKHYLSNKFKFFSLFIIIPIIIFILMLIVAFTVFPKFYLIFYPYLEEAEAGEEVKELEKEEIYYRCC